ncbi:hypothetical protein Q8791_17095 [Nocardiopsis sp. CT-R113]|uniref:Uncharacterized protein n=1 Tax=Nocardiopsis codii TaxID=3065942 RepID=A0ABU7KBJ1_9ACTN|nr:hypothetical protein [Nocardiopsis sp. CT-R113]MEE2038937.1 hypothetical protein [Nocardiopsis sp. CT-R113]
MAYGEHGGGMRARAVCCSVVAATVVLTGCAAEESDPGTQPSRTPPTLAVPASPLPEESALEAYRGMWNVVVEGSHEGAVGHPDLELYASGQALELTTAMLRGVVATGQPVMSPEVVDVTDGASVSVEDCIDDSAWTVQEQTADTTGESGQRVVTATVVAHGGRWLVDDLWLEDYGSC